MNWNRYDAEMQTRCKARNRTLTDTSLEAFPTNKRLLFTCTSPKTNLRARLFSAKTILKCCGCAALLKLYVPCI
jgi:hypothetical protein